MQDIKQTLRNPRNGQFSKKRSFWKRLIRFSVIIGIVVFLFNQLKAPGEQSTQPIIDQVRNSELEQVMNREDLKKQYELMAREVLLKEKKAAIEARYKAEIEAIELELEDVRGQKTSFQ